MRLEVEANHVRGAACLEACRSASVHFGYLFSHNWGQRRENGVRGIHALATWSGIRVSQGNAEEQGTGQSFARRTRTGTGTLMALALGKREESIVCTSMRECKRLA